MGTLDEFIDFTLHYLEIGLEFVLGYVLTVEGIIVLIFLTFLMGFINQIRS